MKKKTKEEVGMVSGFFETQTSPMRSFLRILKGELFIVSISLFIMFFSIFYFGVTKDAYVTFKFALLLLLLSYFAVLALKLRGEDIDGHIKIKSIGSIVIIGFFVSIIYVVANIGYFKQGYPEGSILFFPHDRFKDFINNYVFCVLGGSSRSVVLYPMPFNYIMSFVSLFAAENVLKAYFLFLIPVVCYLLLINYWMISSVKKMKYDQIIYVVAFSLMTYPFIFAIDRGHLELYTFLFLSISMVSYLKGRFDISAFLFALALTQQRIYFVLLAFVFVLDRKYRQFFMIFAYLFIFTYLMKLTDTKLYPDLLRVRHSLYPESVGLFIASLIYLILQNAKRFFSNIFNKISDMIKKHIKMDFDIVTKVILPLFFIFAAIIGIVVFYPVIYKNFLDPGLSYNNVTAIGDAGSAHCSSFYCSLKEFVIFFKVKIGIVKLFNFYTFMVIIMGFLIAAYLIFIEKVLWRKVTIIMLVIILFPFVTADYRLIQILIPIYFFIHYKEKSRYDIYYIMLFGISLIPMKFFILRGNIGIDTMFRPLVLMIFLLLLILDGIQDSVKLKRTKNIKVKKQ